METPTPLPESDAEKTSPTPTQKPAPILTMGIFRQIYTSPFLHACIPPLIIIWFVGLGIWGHANNATVEIPLTLAIFLTGAGGGVLSTYFRLKGLDPSIITPAAILQIYMTPIISGVLGLVCYGMFLTGMLQGALFPEFTKATVYTTFSDIFKIVPADTLSAAKSLLWAFVAGFSEKLIPNMLDQLADRLESDGKAPPPQSPTT